MGFISYIVSDALKICPKCQTKFDLNESFCPHDGAKLVEDIPLTQGSLIGEVLDDTVEIQRFLYKDEMAVRYLGRLVTKDVLVWVTVFDQKFEPASGAKERMETARSLVGAPLPEGVHPALDANFDHIPPYIIHSKPDGPSIFALLEKDKFLPWKRAVQIVASTARVLEWLHECGILFRAIHSGAIFVHENDEVQVGEWAYDALTEISSPEDILKQDDYAFVGQIDYMAPEVAERFDQGDVRSTVYALGVLLYEMVTGMRPMKGASSQETLNRHKLEKPIPIHLAKPSLEYHAELNGIIEMMLSKNPEKRFQTPSAIIAVLANLLNTSPEKLAPKIERSTKTRNDELFKTIDMESVDRSIIPALTPLSKDEDKPVGKLEKTPNKTQLFNAVPIKIEDESTSEARETLVMGAIDEAHPTEKLQVSSYSKPSPSIELNFGEELRPSIEVNLDEIEASPKIEKIKDGTKSETPELETNIAEKIPEKKVGKTPKETVVFIRSEDGEKLEDVVSLKELKKKNILNKFASEAQKDEKVLFGKPTDNIEVIKKDTVVEVKEERVEEEKDTVAEVKEERVEEKKDAVAEVKEERVEEEKDAVAEVKEERVEEEKDTVAEVKEERVEEEKDTAAEVKEDAFSLGSGLDEPSSEWFATSKDEAWDRSFEHDGEIETEAKFHKITIVVGLIGLVFGIFAYIYVEFIYSPDPDLKALPEVVTPVSKVFNISQAVSDFESAMQDDRFILPVGNSAAFFLEKLSRNAATDTGFIKAQKKFSDIMLLKSKEEEDVQRAFDFVSSAKDLDPKNAELIKAFEFLNAKLSGNPVKKNTERVEEINKDSNKIPAEKSVAFEDLKKNKEIVEDTKNTKKSVKELIKKANSAYGRNQFSEAEKLYMKALALSPGNHRIQSGLAAVYFDQSNYPKAAKFYAAATRSNPKQNRYPIALGQAYFRMGKYKKALGVWEIASKKEPNNEQIKKYISLVKRKL